MKYEFDKFEEVTFDACKRRNHLELETAVYDGRELTVEEIAEINNMPGSLVVDLYEDRTERYWEV